MLADRGYTVTAPTVGYKTPEALYDATKDDVGITLKDIRVYASKQAASIVVVFCNPINGGKVGVEVVRGIADIVASHEHLSRVILIYEKSITPFAANQIRIHNDAGALQIETFNTSPLQFNVSRHMLVPQHNLLSATDTEKVVAEYGSTALFPVLNVTGATDAVAKYYNFPVGRLIRIDRPSPTGVTAVSYRLTV